MTKLKNFLPLAFLGLCLWIATSCMDATDKQPTSQTKSFEITNEGITCSQDTTAISFPELQKAVLSADSLSKLIVEYKRIESTQNGVCDTCVTGFVSVLIEHRTVSKKLSDEIEEMNRNLQKVKAYNSEAFGLVNTFQRQSGELEGILAFRTNLIQENNKQIAELRKNRSDLLISKTLLDRSRY